MTRTYDVTVEVSDETAAELEACDDERVSEVLSDALDGLASASDKQDELHERMGVDPGDEEELSGEALETEMRKWLRGKRDDDPRL